jgi:hypothetical protein
MALADFNLGDVGSLFVGLREAITGEKIKDPALQTELLKEIQKAEAILMENKSKVIVAEASSTHYIVSAWRPITMLVFTFIIANNYVIVPYITAFGGHVPILELPPGMWDLLEIGMGGYILGRSAEKAVKAYKGG